MSGTEDKKSKPAKVRGIFERPTGSGIWWVCYFDQYGRRHREKVGPKKLAVDVYQKRKNDVREARFFPDQIRRREITLSDMIDDYLERTRGKLRWFSHYKRYGGRWKDALGDSTLRQIVPGDVDRVIAKRRKDCPSKRKDKTRVVSPATLNRELAFLRRVFNVAIEDGKADSNPVKPHMFAKENNQRVRYLCDEEERTLREAIGEDEWPIVAVAIHTGMRRSEQFNLRWENVDFGTGLITMPRSKHGETRRVPMNDTVREILRTRPNRLKGAFIFPSATGETPIDAQNYVNRTFLPALREARIEGFTWHCLRHTFASRLVMAGVDLRTVQELMGHKTLAMTLRYSHLSPAHQLEAVQRLKAAPSATGTATIESGSKTAVAGTPQVVEFPERESGDAWNRTTDLGIMRPSL